MERKKGKKNLWFSSNYGTGTGGTSWDKRGYFFQTTSKKGDIYASMYPFNYFGGSSHWGFRK